MWAELHPWLSLILQRRLRLATGIVLMAATLFAGIGLLALSGWFITATAVTAMAWAAGVRATLDVYVPGGGIRAFAVTRTVSRYLERLYNHDTVLRLLADLRVHLFQALTRLDGSVRARFTAAQWLNRLVTDVDTLDNLYLRQLAPPLVALLGIALVSGLIGWFAPHIAVLAGGALLLVLCLATVVTARVTRTLSARRVSRQDGLRRQAVEQLRGVAELTASGQLPGHQQRLLNEEASYRRDQRRLLLRTAWVQGLVTFGIQATVILVLMLALMAWQAEHISAPVMVMMPLAIMALGEGLNLLPAAFSQWGATVAAARRLNEQTALVSTQTQPDNPGDVPAHPALTWSGVSVRYGHVAVLSGVTLSLAPGERLGVMGASGCGKSTLAALAARLQDPDQGEVLADGEPLTRFHRDDWQQRLAFLSQDAHLFNESVAENLRLAAPQADEARLWQVLEAVQLAATVRGFERGLDTRIGELGGQLSGGEGRRLALARVLLREAPIVILDEPFTGLDRATAARVETGIAPWLAGRTVLCLAHAPEAMPAMDRYWRLD